MATKKKARVPFTVRYSSEEVSIIGKAAGQINATDLEHYIKFASLKLAELIFKEKQQMIQEKANQEVQQQKESGDAKQIQQDTTGDTKDNRTQTSTSKKQDKSKT